MSSSHGSSPAAWTAVAIFLVGFTISGVALIPDPNWIVFCVGVAFMAASGIVGKIMSAAGLGSDPSH